MKSCQLRRYEYKSNIYRPEDLLIEVLVLYLGHIHIHIHNFICISARFLFSHASQTCKIFDDVWCVCELFSKLAWCYSVFSATSHQASPPSLNSVIFRTMGICHNFSKHIENTNRGKPKKLNSATRRTIEMVKAETKQTNEELPVQRMSIVGASFTNKSLYGIKNLTVRSTLYNLIVGSPRAKSGLTKQSKLRKSMIRRR